MQLRLATLRQRTGDVAGARRSSAPRRSPAAEAADDRALVGGLRRRPVRQLSHRDQENHPCPVTSSNDPFLASPAKS